MIGIQERVMDMSRGVDELLCVQRDQEHEKILEWLTPINYTPQQNDYIKEATTGNRPMAPKLSRIPEMAQNRQADIVLSRHSWSGEDNYHIHRH
jgi:hypothetical protein